MEALAGALIGAVASLVGGVLVRRWEDRRRLRASVLLEHVTPTAEAFQRILDRVRNGVRPYTDDAAESMAKRLAAAAMAASATDYRMAAEVLSNVAVLRGFADGPAAAPGGAWDPKVEAQAVLLLNEVLRSIEEYDSFLHRRLVGRLHLWRFRRMAE